MFKILNVTGYTVILIAWVITTISNYLFFADHNFESKKSIVDLYLFSFIFDATVSFAIAYIICFAVWKIWSALKNLPSLRRDERVMWLHVIVVTSYAGTFLLNAIVCFTAVINDRFEDNEWAFAFNLAGIVQGVLSFAANLILLLLIHRFANAQE